MLDNLYQGAFFDKKNFAKTVYECEPEFNPALSFYFNLDALAEDLFRFDYIALDDGKLCHVFSRRRMTHYILGVKGLIFCKN